MHLVGWAPFEQAAGQVGCAIGTLQIYLCSFSERCCIFQEGYRSSNGLNNAVLTLSVTC
jgi:hypothetical protein